MEIITALLAAWDIAAQVIAVASAIAIVTPWKEDDVAVGKVKMFIGKTVGKFALQFGNAKPK